MKGQSTLLGRQVLARGGGHFLGWDMYHCTEGGREGGRDEKEGKGVSE